MKVLVTSCLLAALVASAGCAQKAAEPVDLGAAAVEARAVVDQFPVVLETEDVDLFSRIMAHDPDIVCFGTDATERWVGYDAVLAALQKQFEAFENVHVAVRDQMVKVDTTADAAWFSEVTDWTVSTGGQTVELKGTRLTGALEKRDGKWVIVQFHTSVPVEGQAAKY